ncbi:hypothetical protein RI129_000208 [Pyrocoelia pectoralis]|uniref:SH3 domain-containing protein n=1 Tax=Pyrocoelia pectoralis TaxID=417401 RepID=A0AAN7VQV5_9COLE
MVEVLVEYDYLSKEPDELTIKKGDIVKDVVKKAGGWWEGVLNDKKGMFPDNFVRVIDKDSQVTFRSRKDVARIRQCRVVFSYKQENQDELNLSIGDVITILGEEEEGWWRGVLNGKEGVFPSNFVEEIKSKPGSREDLTNVDDAKSPSLPPKPVKTMCQVKYAYKAQNDDELTLKEGDIITLVSSDGQDPGWWKGELQGRIGVFPDNFVVVLPEHDDKKTKLSEPTVLKQPPSPQRKSLLEDKVETEVAKTSPPIPSKKPSIPIKKSPSASSSQGGLLAGLRKKIVDVVDGASGSKSQPVLIKANDLKVDNKTETMPENAFDQVERTSLLSDVRATRVKAPGRRPPSVIFKEGEPGIVNGNTDHIALDSLSEHVANTRSNDAFHEQSESEVKPKVREWEKHKAPWLEEMKLNQAKRTSTSPGPEPSRLRLTPTDKSLSPEVEETKSNKVSPFDKPSVSPVDMSKSMSAITNRSKTPPNEIEKNSVVLRNRPAQLVPQTTQRPQTVAETPKPKISPISLHSNPNNNSKPKPSEDKTHDSKADIAEISTKHYTELLQRIEKLESLVYQQNQSHKLAIEELKGKLQVETDMRRLLQAELDKVSQCVMQV